MLERPAPEPSSGAPGVTRMGDRLFGGAAKGAGIVIILLVAAVGFFLIKSAAPVLADNNTNFLFSRDWNLTLGEMRFGIAGMAYTTVLVSLFAMILAVPVAIGIALFLTFWIPRRLSEPLSALIDLLAAVPSVVYGIWGIFVLQPKLAPLSDNIQGAFGWIPLFDSAGVSRGTVFTAGVVLAIMILPIITAISREVFAQVPKTHMEAALGLGATRWEMIRLAVLPFGKSGVISASMLGLGRALGETIAITLILSTPAAGAPFNSSLFNGGETFASKIANNAAEFDSPAKTGAFIAAGLVLFVLTFAVNATARIIVARGENK
ncbi:MAG: phosphate ABC transporter permease subunit PstC [Sporichthyaceae bacterium]